LYSNPPTIYYSIDGTDPSVGGANTSFGTTPLAVILPEGITVLKFFAVDSSRNVEAIQTQIYVVDLTAPAITITSSAPGLMGLLASRTITWQSNEAGSYVVELGGTGTLGSGTVLATGSIAAFTSQNQMILGTQLSYASSTPLWMYVTDSVGHTGSTSVNLSLKPMVPINAGGELGQVAVHPSGLKVYVARRDANAVAVIDADPSSVTFNMILATVPVGIRPTGVAVTPDGSRVYVTNNGATSLDIDSISAIATSSNTVAATVLLGASSAPNGITITPDGTRAYFLRFEGEISVLDVNPASASFHTVTSSIPRSQLSFGAIAVTPDGARAIVNWQGTISHGVDVVDVNPASPTYNTIISSPVPVFSGLGGDVAASSDSGFAFATDSGNFLCRINLQNSLISPAGPPAPQGAFALTPDGTTILMGSPNSSSLRIVNASDLTVALDVPMGAGLGFSGGIAITPDGARAYVNLATISVNSQVVMLPLH
jgi:YVTN family beta-propeller protein